MKLVTLGFDYQLNVAFTPTCSSTHLPGYEKNYDAIRSCGIDEIYCLSVNDAFVMRQWGLHQQLEPEMEASTNPMNPGNFKKVKLIPDGACLFTRGMGMSCVWDSERGFGERSWRYSAVINDMKIEKLFIEVCDTLTFDAVVLFSISIFTGVLREVPSFKTLVLIHSRCQMQIPCLTT